MSRVDASYRRRRWLMPVVILALAVVFFFWGRQQRQQALVDVERFVTGIVQNASAMPTAAPPGLPEQLAAVRVEITGAANAGPVHIAATAGDTEVGDGTATHTAVIEIDGTPRLGLRLLHHGGDPPAVAILGYWVP